MRTLRSLSTIAVVAAFALALGPRAAMAQAGAKQPNILIIWGDDIGQFNISAYNLGVMGYKTPNIDRIAKEGALFTDWYGQQSCTAGRAAFITAGAVRPAPLAEALQPAQRSLRARGNLDRVMEAVMQQAGDR